MLVYTFFECEEVSRCSVPDDAIMFDGEMGCGESCLEFSAMLFDRDEDH